jgi:DNA-binding CsgD family transcriptional regulator
VSVPLTVRELEVCRLLAGGTDDFDEIADELGIGFYTVKKHVDRSKLKLGVRYVNEIPAALERAGLTE